MEQLITLLHSIEEFKDNSKEYEEYEILTSDNIDLNKIVSDASDIANDLLITSEGRCNWANIEFLKAKSFPVRPLEVDNFGWLMGGIYTNKGIITFG